MNTPTIDSPIEAAPFMALAKVIVDMKWPHFVVRSQVEIGNYRTDFQIDYRYGAIKRTLLVECDSQQWHERTERERRYEKARDRYLMKQGYDVFHFTGSEIIATPMKIAQEALVHITEKPPEEIRVEL